jgi:hypothetical protein
MRAPAGTCLAANVGMARTPPTNIRRERYGGAAGRRFQDRSQDWIDRHPDAAEGLDADRAGDEPAIDEVVERLSRDLTDTVDEARRDGRESLASAPIEIAREDAAPHDGPAPSPPTRRARLTFFGVAVWLAVAGAALAFVLPWAGLVCFVMAGLAAVVAAILGPGEPRPERTAESPPPPR